MSAERREHTRLPVRLVVHFGTGDRRFRLMSENLSLGGIFLRGAESRCEPGDEMQLEIVVPKEAGDVDHHRVTTTVVQIVEGEGVGLRFEWSEESGETRAALERFIEQAGMLNSPAVHQEHVGLATDAVEEQ